MSKTPQSNDPWRYRCPNGHTSWRHNQSNIYDSSAEYYCPTCRRYEDNPHFEELVDMKAES